MRRKLFVHAGLVRGGVSNSWRAVNSHARELNLKFEALAENGCGQVSEFLRV